MSIQVRATQFQLMMKAYPLGEFSSFTRDIRCIFLSPKLLAATR